MMSAKKPPFDPDKMFQRALSLHHEGKLKQAEDCYQTLLAYFPQQVEVITPLATALLQQGKHAEGVAQLKKSLSLKPNQPAALYNLGVELQKQVKLDDALACYNQALSLNSQDINCLINRGNTLKDLRRHEEAVASFNHALAINPNAASAQWNKALTLISLGQYEEGWKLYESGWQAGERGVPRSFSQPTWLGEEGIKDKTLLIYAEQGFGDFIQFCRYAAMAEALGAKVILVVSAPLLTLAKSLTGNFTIIKEGEALPAFDYACPVMSLPLAFKTTLTNVPKQTPYLFADTAMQKAWQQTLGKKINPRIGIVWSGSLTNKIDLNPCSKRNVPLAQLQTLFELPFEFHVLQKEFRDEDKATLANMNNLHLHQDELNDFASTAALIAEMDLVISTCTAVAHLSGALAKETWVMLPYTADYRWLLARSDSPWYETVTLFRQNQIGDWSDVVEDVKQRLTAREWKK